METPLEHILTSAYKEDMIAYLKNHPEDFDEAITLSFSDKYPYNWRSTWLLNSCMDKNDNRVKGYTKKIIKTIPQRKDGHQREFLKILEHMELDDEDEGTLLDVCINLWEKIDKSPSVRYTAFMFINKMVSKYPELAHEMELLTEDRYLDSLSPGIKFAVNRIIQKL